MIKNWLSIVMFLTVSVTIAQSVLTGKVIAIKDGDTVVVIDSLNTQTTLRLAEVDCPEKNQPFGTKAKQFTSDQVYLKIVKYTITDTDRYGRSIAMIYYDDDKYLSAEIIRSGMGWHYKKYSKSIELAELEIIAKNEKRGLWIDKNPISPSDWRNK
jgi:endonuclease YncB( thermonuclease family)